MSWMDDIVTALQQGGAPGPTSGSSPFPAPPAVELQGQALWDQIEAQQRAENARSDRRNAAGMARAPIVAPFGMPDMNSAGVQLAMDQAPAGTGVPVDGSPQFAPFSMGGPPVPPSMQLATAISKPPIPDPTTQQPPAMSAGAPPVPAPVAPPTPPIMAQGGDEGDAPTDVSARRRAPDAAPMSMAAAAPSIMDRIGKGLNENGPLLMALGAGLAGAPSFGEGISRGLANAMPIGAARQKQQEDLALAMQSQNITAQALLKKGVPPEDVAAALKSPEMLKALIGQYYAKDKGVKLEKFKDASGREVAAWVDPDNKTILSAKVPGMGEPGETPALNEAQNRRVQAIIEGREPYPSPNTRSGDAQLIREAVHTADPNFDAVNYNSRQQTRKNFTSGKAAGNVTAFNTAIGHLGTLYDSIDGLGNRSSPWWNAATRPLAENTDTKYASNVKKFETARTAVADELTRAFRGSGGNVHDIIQWEKAISAADSPEALKSAVKQAAELLNSRISSLGDEYNRGMGTTKSHMELLNPKAQESFQHLLEGGRPAAAAKPAGTVTIGGQSIPWSVH